MEILVRDLINDAKNLLIEADILDAQNDSWLLAEHVFGITKGECYVNPEMSVSEKNANQYWDLVKQRANNIPLQHLTGTQEFMGFCFCVNKDVLVPRQDTELLVEKVVEYINSCQKTVNVLDMCTGSGCIAISINQLCPNARVTAVDISEKALQVAEKNCKLNNAEVELIQSDLFDKIYKKYDVIVSNPPYIRTEEISNLMTEVKEHEPLIALDGDTDGLKFYKRISERLNRFLRNDGKIFFEIGYDQGITVPNILRQYGFEEIKVYKDLSGNDRVVTASSK